jgi:hypothetical protein
MARMAQLGFMKITGSRVSRGFLQICNVSRETFDERLRLLAAGLDFDTEASLVLDAGISCQAEYLPIPRGGLRKVPVTGFTPESRLDVVADDAIAT